MLCVPSARHLFGTASLASSALSASAELLVNTSDCITNFTTDLESTSCMEFADFVDFSIGLMSSVYVAIFFHFFCV